jgi:hypothetical protein
MDTNIFIDIPIKEKGKIKEKEKEEEIEEVEEEEVEEEEEEAFNNTSNDDSERLTSKSEKSTRSDNSSNINLFSSRDESISSYHTLNNSPSPNQSKQLNENNLNNSIKNINNINNNNNNNSKKNRLSHNKIEKKYRTNINTKFIELKNVVPTLRIVDNDTEIDFDELEGLIPASKLNKANILSKATEYIKHLEIKNKSLLDEIRNLRSNPNYNYQPLNNLHHLPIEVINNLPNQPQISNIILPNNELPNYRLYHQQQEHQPHQQQHYHYSHRPHYDHQHPLRQESQQQQQQQQQEFIHYNSQNQSQDYYNPNISPINMNNPSNGNYAISSGYQDPNIDKRNCYGYSSTMQINNNLRVIDHSQDSLLLNHDDYNNNNNQQNTDIQPIPQLQQLQTNQNYNIDPHSYPSEASFEQNNNYSLNHKILVGGIATLIGSNISDSFDLNNHSSNFKSLNSIPLPFIFNKLIKLIQLFTFLSCIYYFIKPIINSFINWKKEHQKRNVGKSFHLIILTTFINIFLLNSFELNYNFISKHRLFSKKTTKNQTSEVFPIDLTAFPNSFMSILIAYIKILNISDLSNCKSLKILNPNLPNPIEHTFNKIIILDLILRRFPIFGYLLGFEKRIEFLINLLLKISKNTNKNNKNNKNNNNNNEILNSRIINFIHFDPNFINSRSVINQLSEILYSLDKTKSSKLTAEILYGSNIKKNKNSGCGYNSVYEYLINTSTNKLNLFELVSILWCVGNVRSRMVIFLSQIVNEVNIIEKNTDDDFQNDIKNLIDDIQKIESFIPIPCIKLIKCCKIFKCLLDPKNELFLNDALKLILLNVEENLIKIKKQNNLNNEILENLLIQSHSSMPVLPKVLQIIKTIQNSTLIHSNSSNLLNRPKSIVLMSDENRISLLCSIILHQYMIGNYQYGCSLIKYLKSEKTCKFMCSNSISLMALIATFRTLVVILEHENKLKLTQSYKKDYKDAYYIDYDNDNDTDSEFDSEIDSMFENNNYDSLSTDYENNALLDANDHHILEDLLCGLRLYTGQNCGSITNVEDSADYDILSLHYGLQSELSHRLLELAKELVGYTE